jgi:pre-mRNA-processing factor 6
MIKSQIEDMDLNNQAKARETLNKAVKACPKSVTLWILLARLEEKSGMLVKSRATLEKARYTNPKTAELWVEAIRIENRANNVNAARNLAAKALQECPTSSLLWSEIIYMEPRAQRKSKSVDALKKCEQDPLIVTAVARLFWTERKIDKARDWFQKAAKIDSDQGDVYAWWYRFELQHGTEVRTYLDM